MLRLHGKFILDISVNKEVGRDKVRCLPDVSVKKGSNVPTRPLPPRLPSDFTHDTPRDCDSFADMILCW